MNADVRISDRLQTSDDLKIRWQRCQPLLEVNGMSKAFRTILDVHLTSLDVLLLTDREEYNIVQCSASGSPSAS